MEKLTQFDNYFKARIANENTTLPYFLYVITPKDQDQLVSFSLYDDTPPGTENQTVLDHSTSKRSIKKVINGDISEKLQLLYEKSRSFTSIPKSTTVYEPLSKACSVGSINISSQGEVKVVPEPESEKSTVDKIIEYYTKDQDKLKRAVEDINNRYTVNLLTNDHDDVSDVTGVSGPSQQSSYKSATDDLNITIADFTHLLQLPQNIAQLKDKPYQPPIISKMNEPYVYIHRFHKQIKC